MSAVVVEVEGGQLAVEDEGRGEAVLFVAGGLIADAFAPLCAQPAVARGRRLLRPHRRGYGRTALPGPVSVARDAADCLAVLDALGIDRAHLVGWSHGGTVALQAALDRPGAVASLTLLEPALFTVPAAAGLAAVLGPAAHAWAEGDRDRALDLFHAPLWGPGWRPRLEAAIPGGVAQLERDAGTLLDSDLPALGAWAAAAVDVGSLAVPVLLVGGDAGGAPMEQFREQVTAWLPPAETVTLPGADHSFPVTRAADLAGPLVGFLDRHARQAAPVS